MDLKDAREKIDSIDEKLVDLFVERMRLSCEIAKAKAKDDQSIYNPVREREVLSNVMSRNEDFGMYTKRLYMTIFELSKSYQRVCRKKL